MINSSRKIAYCFLTRVSFNRIYVYADLFQMLVGVEEDSMDLFDKDPAYQMASYQREVCKDIKQYIGNICATDIMG